MRWGGLHYRNAWPLQRGLPAGGFCGTPSETATAFAEGKIDLALLPVAAILQGGWEKKRVPGVLIAADGPAYSVYVTWPQGMNPARLPIYRDPASRSSNMLYEVLRREISWFGAQFSPLLAGDISPALPSAISCGRVLIGDTAIAYRSAHPEEEYIDLAAVWREYTGWPFVFAQWVSRQVSPLDWAEPLASLRDANLAGLDAWTSTWSDPDFWRHYLRQLCYQGNERTDAGLSLFAELARRHGLLG